jgi:hypothetical protein
MRRGGGGCSRWRGSRGSRSGGLGFTNSAEKPRETPSWSEVVSRSPKGLCACSPVNPCSAGAWMAIGGTRYSTHASEHPIYFYLMLQVRRVLTSFPGRTTTRFAGQTCETVPATR